MIDGKQLKNGTLGSGKVDSTIEVTSNKSTDATLSANSDTLYPSQKAVKTYVTNNGGGLSGGKVYAIANNFAGY